MYGITSHITFKKPTVNKTVLSPGDALIVKTSNQKSSTGCCGSSGDGSSNDTHNNSNNGVSKDTIKVEDATDNTQFIERHMSDAGKIVLRKLELSEGYGNKCGLFGNGVYPDNIEIYPYWVGDNGITIGFGHYISANDVNDEAALISKLGLQNAKFNVTYKDLDPNYVKGNKKPLAKRVTDSKPVDVATVNTLFNDDVAEMESIVNAFCSGNNDGDVKIALTQQEFDALIIYRFKAGELGQTIADLLKGKNRERGNWKDAFHSGDRGEKELAIFFNDPGCYN